MYYFTFSDVYVYGIKYQSKLYIYIVNDSYISYLIAKKKTVKKTIIRPSKLKSFMNIDKD